MDLQEMESLAAMMAKYNLTSLRVQEEKLDIRMERGCPGLVPAAPYASPVLAAEAPMAAPVAEKGEEVLDLTKTHEIHAPVVGVFYSAAGPDQPPFVKVGDHVKKGQVLCIVEAMKLMNEIVADQDGEVVDICAENGQLVEFDQCLLKLY